MKLTGEIILDEKTTQQLKEEVRVEVLKDIEKDGLDYEEALKFIKSINSITGFRIFFIDSLSEFLPKIKSEDFHFDDEKIFNKLKMCLEIMKM